MKAVGFIGVGNMGRGMCENIIKKGYTTTVYDINPEALAYFQNLAQIASSNLDVLKSSDVILLSLPSSDIVEKVIGEFLKFGVANKTVVDVSTSYPESTKMLYAQIKEQGGKYMDAPLLGGPAQTAAGTAPCMISGDKDDVDSVIDIISCYASPIDYFGSIGSAHTVKIAMNFSSLMYTALSSQMFPLMEKMGIDIKNLYQIMSKGPFGNWIFDFHGPKIVNKNYHKDFALELALKDMRYMKQLYEKFNVPAFLLDGGLNLMRQAVKEGRGKHDVSEMAAVMYEYLGLDTGERNV